MYVRATRKGYTIYVTLNTSKVFYGCRRLEQTKVHFRVLTTNAKAAH